MWKLWLNTTACSIDRLLLCSVSRWRHFVRCHRRNLQVEVYCLMPFVYEFPLSVLSGSTRLNTSLVFNTSTRSRGGDFCFKSFSFPSSFWCNGIEKHCVRAKIGQNNHLRQRQNVKIQTFSGLLPSLEPLGVT